MTSPSPSERAGPPRGGRRCSSRRGRAFFQSGLRVSGRRIGVPREKRHSPVPTAQYQCKGPARNLSSGGRGLLYSSGPAHPRRDDAQRDRSAATWPGEGARPPPFSRFVPICPWLAVDGRSQTCAVDTARRPPHKPRLPTTIYVSPQGDAFDGGGVSRAAKGADCKSAGLRLRRFESYLPHQPSRLFGASAGKRPNAKAARRSRLAKAGSLTQNERSSSRV